MRMSRKMWQCHWLFVLVIFNIQNFPVRSVGDCGKVKIRSYFSEDYERLILNFDDEIAVNDIDFFVESELNCRLFVQLELIELRLGMTQPTCYILMNGQSLIVQLGYNSSIVPNESIFFVQDLQKLHLKKKGCTEQIRVFYDSIVDFPLNSTKKYLDSLVLLSGPESKISLCQLVRINTGVRLNTGNRVLQILSWELVEQISNLNLNILFPGWVGQYLEFESSNLKINTQYVIRLNYSNFLGSKFSSQFWFETGEGNLGIYLGLKRPTNMILDENETVFCKFTYSFFSCDSEEKRMVKSRNNTFKVQIVTQQINIGNYTSIYNQNSKQSVNDTFLVNEIVQVEKFEGLYKINLEFGQGQTGFQQLLFVVECSNARQIYSQIIYQRPSQATELQFSEIPYFVYLEQKLKLTTQFLGNNTQVNVQEYFKDQKLYFSYKSDESAIEINHVSDFIENSPISHTISDQTFKNEQRKQTIGLFVTDSITNQLICFDTSEIFLLRSDSEKLGVADFSILHNSIIELDMSENKTNSFDDSDSTPFYSIVIRKGEFQVESFDILIVSQLGNSSEYYLEQIEHFQIYNSEQDKFINLQIPRYEHFNFSSDGVSENMSQSRQLHIHVVINFGSFLSPVVRDFQIKLPPSPLIGSLTLLSSQKLNISNSNISSNSFSSSDSSLITNSSTLADPFSISRDKSDEFTSLESVFSLQINELYFDSSPPAVFTIGYQINNFDSIQQSSTMSTSSSSTEHYSLIPLLILYECEPIQTFQFVLPSADSIDLFIQTSYAQEPTTGISQQVLLTTSSILRRTVNLSFSESVADRIQRLKSFIAVRSEKNDIYTAVRELMVIGGEKTCKRNCYFRGKCSQKLNICICDQGYGLRQCVADKSEVDEFYVAQNSLLQIVLNLRQSLPELSFFQVNEWTQSLSILTSFRQGLENLGFYGLLQIIRFLSQKVQSDGEIFKISKANSLTDSLFQTLDCTLKFIFQQDENVKVADKYTQTLLELIESKIMLENWLVDMMIEQLSSKNDQEKLQLYSSPEIRYFQGENFSEKITLTSTLIFDQSNENFHIPENQVSFNNSQVSSSLNVNLIGSISFMIVMQTDIYDNLFYDYSSLFPFPTSYAVFRNFTLARLNVTNQIRSQLSSYFIDKLDEQYSFQFIFQLENKKGFNLKKIYDTQRLVCLSVVQNATNPVDFLGQNDIIWTKDACKTSVISNDVAPVVECQCKFQNSIFVAVVEDQEYQFIARPISPEDQLKNSPKLFYESQIFYLIVQQTIQYIICFIWGYFKDSQRSQSIEPSASAAQQKYFENQNDDEKLRVSSAVQYNGTVEQKEKEKKISIAAPLKDMHYQEIQLKIDQSSPEKQQDIALSDAPKNYVNEDPHKNQQKINNLITLKNDQMTWQKFPSPQNTNGILPQNETSQPNSSNLNKQYSFIDEKEKEKRKDENQLKEGSSDQHLLEQNNNDSQINKDKPIISSPINLTEVNQIPQSTHGTHNADQTQNGSNKTNNDGQFKSQVTENTDIMPNSPNSQATQKQVYFRKKNFTEIDNLQKNLYIKPKFLDNNQINSDQTDKNINDNEEKSSGLENRNDELIINHFEIKNQFETTQPPNVVHQKNFLSIPNLFNFQKSKNKKDSLLQTQLRSDNLNINKIDSEQGDKENQIDILLFSDRDGQEQTGNQEQSPPKQQRVSIIEVNQQEQQKQPSHTIDIELSQSRNYTQNTVSEPSENINLQTQEPFLGDNNNEPIKNITISKQKQQNSSKKEQKLTPSQTNPENSQTAQKKQKQVALNQKDSEIQQTEQQSAAAASSPKKFSIFKEVLFFNTLISIFKFYDKYFSRQFRFSFYYIHVLFILSSSQLAIEQMNDYPSQTVIGTIYIVIAQFIIFIIYQYLRIQQQSSRFYFGIFLFFVCFCFGGYIIVKELQFKTSEYYTSWTNMFFIFYMIDFVFLETLFIGLKILVFPFLLNQVTTYLSCTGVFYCLFDNNFIRHMKRQFKEKDFKFPETI